MKKQKAFTLTELLIVITIILMLINLIMPAVMSAVALADKIECQSNLRQIGIAGVGFLVIEQYFPGEWWATGFPSGTRWPMRFVPYLKENRDIFWCPSSPESLKWDDGRIEPGGTNFTWIPRFSYGLNTRGSFVGKNYQPDGGWWSVGDKQGLYPSEITLAANFIWIADSNDGDSEDPWIYVGSKNNGIVINATFNVGPTWHPPHKLWPGKRHSGGANFLFADGHVEWIKRGIEYKAAAYLPVDENDYDAIFAGVYLSVGHPNRIWMRRKLNRDNKPHE